MKALSRCLEAWICEAKDMKQGWRKEAARQNLLLAEELGRTISGESRYRWIWSEDREFYRSKRLFSISDDNRIQPEWDEKPSGPDGSLVVPVAKYVREKLVPQISRCFVMCRWIPNATFSEHQAKYGDMIEWPGEGSYWPMEHPRGIVQLCPEVCPGDEDTWDFIRLVRKDTQLGMEAILAKAEKADAEESRRAFEANAARIDPLLPAFDAIPGKRGSGGIWARIRHLETQDHSDLGFSAHPPQDAQEPLIQVARD